MTATDLEELIPTGYYAIIDTYEPGLVSCWYMTKPDRNGKRHLKPWPPKSRPGPKLGPRPEMLDSCDFGPGAAERRRAVCDEWVRPVVEYHAAVERAILDDLEGAGARFAHYATRCCMCGRALKDPKSRYYGIGPECDNGLSDGDMARMATAVGRAVAEAEARVRHQAWLAEADA